MIKTGFSVYLGTEIEKTAGIIKKAEKAGAEYVFTSLNISEEKTDKEKKLLKIIDMCSKNKLKLIVDINSMTKDIIDIKQENVYLRIDDGLTKEEILEVSKKQKIVLNASTVVEEDLKYFKENNADFSRILSLHNFYPKRFTGISRKYLKEQNLKYRKYGIKTMAFVKGDVLRGPVYEGLPTVEEHREKRFLTACLDLISLYTDIVLIGDIDICDEKWEEFKYLGKEIIPLRNFGNIMTGILFSDRQDSSEYVVRFTASGIGGSRKEFAKYITKILKESGITYESLKKNNEKNGELIKRGDILLSNSKYMRYEAELEIALRNLGKDDKRYIITEIKKEDLELLDYISILKKCMFIKSI